MNKPVWFASEFGADSFVFIAVDMLMPSGALFGMRHAVHPFEVDENPQVLANVVKELSESVERLSAPTHPVSRACAFANPEEIRP